MTLLLLDTRNDKHYLGENTREVVLATGRVTLDFDGRRVVIDGKPDTVSFSSDYSHEEVVREACLRALHVLTRDYGFKLFR